MTIETNAWSYALACHRDTNHMYNDLSYEYHLRMVVIVAQKFIDLIPEKDRDNVLAACWCHDVIEDCRQSYNDVKENTNAEVAELVYALTTEKGRSRKERANDKYYEGILSTRYAVFIKMCDRIANYQYSIDNRSRMKEVYDKEMVDFFNKIFDPKYRPMFIYLRNLQLNNLIEIK